jgi:hypothetical protein
MGDAALELSGSELARLPVALCLLDRELQTLYAEPAGSRRSTTETWLASEKRYEE